MDEIIDQPLPAAAASPQPCTRELLVVDLLTVDELAEIDAREKAATRGVDVPAGGDDWYSAALPEDVEGHDMWPIYTDGNGGVDTIGYCYLPADASFVGNARQDIPRLHKHIDAQSAEIEQLRAQLAKFSGESEIGTGDTFAFIVRALRCNAVNIDGLRSEAEAAIRYFNEMHEQPICSGGGMPINHDPATCWWCLSPQYEELDDENPAAESSALEAIDSFMGRPNA